MVASSALDSVPRLDSSVPAFTYFVEADLIRAHATLVAGSWPERAGVAIPQVASRSLQLPVGAQLATGSGDVVQVVGIYRADKSSFWNHDILNGKGEDKHFPKPDTRAEIPTDTFGPLIVSPVGLDEAGIAAKSVDIFYSPSFTRLDPDGLAQITNNLENADNNVTADMAGTGGRVLFSTNLSAVVANAGDGLIVTRSAVVVVGLLLLVMASLALVQAANLLSSVRVNDRSLMVARGASARQLALLGSTEALAIAAVAALTCLPIAEGVYAVVARQPAMAAAGMPGVPALVPSDWFSAASAAAFAFVVLVAPVITRRGSDSAGRRSRLGGVARSGLDLGVIALAALALWQLQIYRTPVDRGASFSLDPVLVLGPAVVLIAGALVAARVVGPAARVAQGIATRSTGVVFPLAGWELGRRTQRATAAILLITLTLAVGTFSASFLATWKQSQSDQAALAVGAPVVVPGSSPVPQKWAPQPVIRRSAGLAAPDADLRSANPETTPATVLALTSNARDLLTRGRSNDAGGSTIHSQLRSNTAPVKGLSLRGDVQGISATVRLGSTVVPGVAGEVRAMLQNSLGTIQTMDLGKVPIDGRKHRVSGTGAIGTGTQFVGYQVEYEVTDKDSYRSDLGPTSADLLFGELIAFDAAKTRTEPLIPLVVKVASPSGWSARASYESDSPPEVRTGPQGWQYRISTLIPQGLSAQPETVVAMAWKTPSITPVVLSQSLANGMGLLKGNAVTVIIDGAQVPVLVAAVVPIVPGAIHTDASIVMDQVSLQRSLASQGVSTPMVDEWWVDVPPGSAQTYIDSLHRPRTYEPPRSAVFDGLLLQQGPLRVATQAALWLTISGAAILAAMGFGVHMATSSAARRSEFAHLRALGLQRKHITAVVCAESLLIAALGTVFGVSLGVLLATSIGPVLTVSPDGTPTIPSVHVIVPAAQISALVIAVNTVLAIVVLIVARGQGATDPARILREGQNW